MKTKVYPPLKKLSRAEGRRLFARQVRQSLGMKPEDFIRKWTSGELNEKDSPDVMRLAMMIPLGR